jgi:hypothetical protein
MAYLTRALALGPLLATAGCDPVVSIAGANFPDWLLCVLHGAKWMLAELRGTRIKDRVCREVRKRTEKPFPYIVPLAPDGKRYGFDSDADVDGP